MNDNCAKIKLKKHKMPFTFEMCNFDIVQDGPNHQKYIINNKKF